MSSEARTLDEVLSEIRVYTDHEGDRTAVLANVAAVLKAHRKHYAWVGFYLFGQDAQEMILGPYQGPPTCTTRIPLSAGMCGLAARERQTIVLSDVRSDPRYIACSPTVRSEIVVPLVDGQCTLGVLDVDSEAVNAFGPDDQRLLEATASYLVAKCWRRQSAQGSCGDARGRSGTPRVG